MMNPTLLHQCQTAQPAVSRDRTFKRLVSEKNFKERVAQEKRDETPIEETTRTFVEKRGFAMRRAGTADPDFGARSLERIIKGNDLVPVNYLERGVGCARAVCRIRLMNTSRETVGFATGFMVGRGVLLTNQHVLPTAAHARFARAEFGFEHDPSGGDRVPAAFDFDLRTRPIIRADLDFCFVAVHSQSIDGQAFRDDFGWLVLDSTPGKTLANEYLTIIQHPAGERKQVCVRENRLIEYQDHTLWYQTDTVAGSSGSPVFNNSWQVAALHHSGVPDTNRKHQILTTDGRVYEPDKMKESLIAWKANEGIRISSILACLRGEHLDHRLAQAVLAATPYPIERSTTTDGVHGASVTVPVFVSGGRRAPHLSALDSASEAGEPLAELGFSALFESTKKPPKGTIATFPSRAGDDLSDRKGYQADFLGDGKLRVPMPTVSKNHSFNKPMTWGPGGKKTVLPYSRHSVLLSQERRLAIWAAVNVDDNLRFSQPGSDPEWIKDPRLTGRDLGDEFYKESPGVKTESQGKRKSPFDRGHQVQQEDATWGSTAAVAAKNSADTFYFPNSAPQILKFNQSGKAWQGLEDYCIEVFAAKTGRACVISGAIFDAPKASGSPTAGTLALPIKPTGARVTDPKFLGIRVPKAFYKIVVCSDGQQLRAAAFIMSQQFQLDKLKGTPIVDVQETLTSVQARIFFVNVQVVASLTGLDFGANVKAAQVNTLEAIRLGRGTEPGAELRSLADLRL
jgi:endonuclease G